MTSEKTSFDKFLDTIQPFWIGGFSGMFATSIIQPIDMVKVLIQLKSEQGQKATAGAAIADVMAKDGIKGFYRGYFLFYLVFLLPWPGNFSTQQLG